MGAAACTRISTLGLPQVPGAKTAIVSLGVDHGPALEVIDLRPGRMGAARVTLDHGSSIGAVLYPRTIEELHVEQGPLPDVRSLSRPLPPKGTAFELADAERGGWIPSSTSADVFKGHRLPSVDLAVCESSGGCNRRDHGQDYCETPCEQIAWIDPEHGVAPPSPPVHPLLLPCPEGWSEMAAQDVTTCEPPAALDCADGEAQLASSSACAPLDGPCPSGEFATGLPVDALYVSATGACNNPPTMFCTIESAIRAAHDGGTIAIGKGVFATAITATRSVHLRGACAGATMLQPSSGASAVVIVGGVAAVGIQDLSVDARSQDGIRIDPMASATIQGVSIVGARRGLQVGGSVDASRLSLRSTDRAIVAVGSAARLLLDHALVIGSGTYAVGLDGAFARLSDVWIRQTGALGIGDAISASTCVPGDDLGAGITAVRGSTLSVDSSVIDASSGDAVRLVSTPSASLSSLVARASGGSGVIACSSSTVRARRARIEGSGAYGVQIGGTADLSDVVVRSSGNSGVAVFLDASGSSRATLARLLVDRTSTYGIWLSAVRPGSVAELTDIDVRNESSDLDAPGSVVAGQLASFDVTRMAISNGVGVAVSLTNQANTIRDLSVGFVQNDHAVGIDCICPAACVSAPDLIVERARFQHCVGRGIRLDPARARLSDILIEDTVRDKDMLNRAGLLLLDTSSASVDRFAFIHNADMDARAEGGALLSLKNGLIASTTVGLSIATLPNEAQIEEGVVYHDNVLNVEAPNR
jgi:hypothetical protein